MRLTIIITILFIVTKQIIGVDDDDGERSKLDIENANVMNCNVSDDLKKEIQSYRDITKKIIYELTDGKWKGFVYNEISKFVDRFGFRMAGTQNLENSIDYMLDKLDRFDLDGVKGENVTIPHWVRGSESAFLITPRRQKLAILGLGYSVGTPPGGILAEAIVVNSFEELDQIGPKVSGKIVVFNQTYLSYPKTVKYRSLAASKAVKYGAVATLIRSITPYSLYTPHTGMQDYQPGVPKIPAAAITVEDAHMLARMQARGSKLTIKLEMGAKLLPDSQSRNVIADITGNAFPDKSVVVSGHIDSWDVGQGALDDAGGAFLSWGALAVLKKLNLRPKRTLRSILWTAEEEGLIGAEAYFKRHQSENDKLTLLMESDEGTFTPLGLEFRGSNDAACILQEILKLLKPINATQLKRGDSVGSDISIWDKTDVPTAALLNKNEKYFWYHHTDADTMDALNSDDLDKCTAVWATVSYIVADLSIDLPRK
nr:carboxypeptidase Q-like [Onthophagus taurus]